MYFIGSVCRNKIQICFPQILVLVDFQKRFPSLFYWQNKMLKTFFLLVCCTESNLSFQYLMNDCRQFEFQFNLLCIHLHLFGGSEVMFKGLNMKHPKYGNRKLLECVFCDKEVEHRQQYQFSAQPFIISTIIKAST